MGTTDSKQKLGERVLAARKKLSDDMKIQSQRVQEIESQSPETMKVILESVRESFKSCSPFLEPTLLIAWCVDQDECAKIILDSCKRVLNAPINKDEYSWFIKYVFPSSVWMFKNKNNRFMYEELIDIANNMQQDIINIMNSIYNHLQSHPKWTYLANIKNQTIVSRQDHKKAGLLKGISEMKQMEEKSDDLQTFIDTNLAVNILTTTAKNINNEFQNYIQTVMNHYGDFKSGPIKKVDRCISKLENDYSDAQYPKSAKLLDLVRCSVTFNTVDQLVAGYDGLMKHISNNSSSIELARVKNGFLNSQYSGGYRDIKLNVIYHSSINPSISMICEVQLLLGQYLHEKKRIHKLYSIVRQQTYFKMIVAGDDKQQLATGPKDMSDLKFEPVLNAGEEVVGVTKLNYSVGKCTVDSELGCLALETQGGISCIDINNKKMIFNEKRPTGDQCMHTHSWGVIDGEKYISIQSDKNTIKFYKVTKNGNSFVEAKELTICLGETDKITCCEFDNTFENVIIVKNGDILEKRRVKKGNDILVSINLEQKIQSTNLKILSVSNDGKWCVIGGGKSVSYFYLIEIDKKIQHKVISSKLQSSRSPCFINGEANFCVVGGRREVEVWDVEKKVSVQLIDVKIGDVINCLTSTNNILAVGSNDRKLSLWDTRKWEMFWSETYKDMYPGSVHLTNDSKYVTIGGFGSKTKCMIYSIK